MTRMENLLQHLVDTFTDSRAGRLSEAGLVVDDVVLDLPVETRFGPDGAVLMTLPRGMLATGFSLPHGRLRLHCTEVAS